MKKKYIVIGMLGILVVSLLFYGIPTGIEKYNNMAERTMDHYNCMIGFATDYCVSINLSDATYYGDGFKKYKYFLCKDESKRIYENDQKYLLTVDEVGSCDALVSGDEK